jgi:hypothetical protein
MFSDVKAVSAKVHERNKQAHAKNSRIAARKGLTV